MINLGIHKISDIVKPGGTFLTWFDLQARGLQSKNVLLWCGLIDALPLKWKQILRTVTTLPRTPFAPTNFTLLLKSKRLTLTEINTKKIDPIYEKRQLHRSDLMKCFLDVNLIGTKFTACLSK